MKSKHILKSFSELPAVEVVEPKATPTPLVSCDGNIWPAHPADQRFTKTGAGQWRPAPTREMPGCPGSE